MDEEYLLDLVIRVIRKVEKRESAVNYKEVSEPLSFKEVEAAEAKLGFKLPPLFRMLYTQIGNGGFGPGQGLYPLDDSDPGEESVVKDFLFNKEDTMYVGTEYEWPEKLLEFCYLHGDDFLCIDCNSEEGPILLFSDGEISPRAPSLAAWLETWLGSKDKG